ATSYFDSLLNNGSVSITVGDFDEDGKLDVATPAVGVFRGNGDGSFQVPLADYLGAFGSFVAQADLNKDGHIDLITSSGGGVSVLLGNGDGTFQGSPDYGPVLGADSVVE